MEKRFFVYILASTRNGTLYVGVTSNLVQRIWQHKNGETGGFVAKHKVFHLVYFEPHDNAESAIVREKRLKHWRRAWKLKLIEDVNPYWRDLYEEIQGEASGFPLSRE